MNSPRDARLAVLAIALSIAVWLPILRPQPGPHIEHHHIRRPAPTPTGSFTVGYHTIPIYGSYVRLDSVLQWERVARRTR